MSIYRILLTPPVLLLLLYILRMLKKYKVASAMLSVLWRLGINYCSLTEMLASLSLFYKYFQVNWYFVFFSQVPILPEFQHNIRLVSRSHNYNLEFFICKHKFYAYSFFAIYFSASLCNTKFLNTRNDNCLLHWINFY